MVLLQGLGEGTPERGITRLPVKQAVLEIPDSMKKAPENWMASCVVTGHLVAFLRVQEYFRTADHSACLREGSTALRKRRVLMAEEALAETLAGALVQGTCRLNKATKMMAWLTLHLSMANGTELGVQEW